MVVKKGWGATGLALVAAVGVFFLVQPGDAARIRRQLTEAAESVSKPPGEQPLIGAAQAKRLRALVTETLVLHAPAYDYHGELAASDLPAMVLNARAPYKELSLAFYDETIAFPEENRAMVRVTSRMRGRLSSGEWIEDVQELDLLFRKIENEWRIAAVEVVEVLQR